MRACAEEHYDLVVLDVSLPGIDGFEVLRQLRRDNHSGSILILTAHDAEADRVRGLDLGADDYVTKPFSLPELEARSCASAVSPSTRWHDGRASDRTSSTSPRVSGRCSNTC
jgi:DNA-binding response OmpR family regulator